MARESSALVFVYSGGAANSSPLLSVGGPVSQVAGAKYIASQSYTASSIPGIAITHAARNPTGSGTLSYTASNQSITWLNPLGVSSTVVLGGTGWAAVGTTTTGYLRLNVTSLPGADHSQSVTIANVLNSLFGAPAGNEITNGSTEYRALYLVNESSATVTDVVMALTQTTPASDVTIGSTFNPVSQYATPEVDALNFGYLNPATGCAPYSTSLSALFPREQLAGRQNTTAPKFHYFPTDSTQDSDGSTTDVELQLVNRYDPTGKLGGVLWGSSLSWGTILPNRMVSFWVKRVIPPNPTIPVSEDISLDLTFVAS